MKSIISNIEKIERSNTLISTSIETAADFIGHVKEGIKTKGDASGQGLSEIESKLSLLECNVKDGKETLDSVEVEDDAWLDAPTEKETTIIENWLALPVTSVLAEEETTTNNS